MTAMYAVVVGNVGMVYSGDDCKTAHTTYSEYVKYSKAGHGRASGENVTMFHNGEIQKEFIGSLHEE